MISSKSYGPVKRSLSGRCEVMLTPINFKKWIDEHRHLLKPPVGNQQIWEDREFMVTVVGGPNSRKDYHVNHGEEFFHQIEGDMILQDHGKGKAGRYSHSGRRDSSSAWRRAPFSTAAGGNSRPGHRAQAISEREGWFCLVLSEVREKLYEEFVEVKNLVTDLLPVFDRFYGSSENSTCKRCGTQVSKS